MGKIREIVLRQSLRLPVRADTSLYTREALGCGGGREVFALLRSDPSSVSCADTFPSRGRLGALPRQRKDLGAGVDGEVTTPQSALLTAPLTSGAIIHI